MFLIIIYIFISILSKYILIYSIYIYFYIKKKLFISIIDNFIIFNYYRYNVFLFIFIIYNYL